MNLSEAIKKLKSENELCLENREGECGGYNYKDGKCYCAGSIIVRALEEYIKIGTVEECREARERQGGGEKPVIGNDNRRPRKCCSVCGCFYSPTSKYCPKCGQGISQEGE